MTIILDLDDVLANLRESLYQTLKQATGIDRHWRDWDHYDLRLHYAIGNPHLEAILIRERALEACEPEPDAITMVQTLVELGFEIAIVTARGWHPRARALTRRWLDEYNIPHQHLHVVPLSGNKLEALERFADVALAVDDHPSHVQRYQSVGIPTLLMDRPWNAGFEGNRVYSMVDVVEHVRSSLA